VVACEVTAICAMAQKCTEIGIGHADDQAARDIATIMRQQCNS
jgi:hypothetical protein